MVLLEQQNYGRRVHGLLQIAQAAVMQEAQRAQLDMYEEPLGQLGSPAHKITVHTWKDDLTRIHEAARKAGIYSEKTEVSQIVEMYYIERPRRSVQCFYRANRSRIDGRAISDRSVGHRRPLDERK